MKPANFVGKTLEDLAVQTHVFFRPIHIFVLEDATDTTGKHLMEAFTVRQVIDRFPASANAVVVSVIEICGEINFRVKVKGNDPELLEQIFQERE